MRYSRAPLPFPPPGSCDCQVHAFSADLAGYPPRPDRKYDPPAATLEALRCMHAALGIERCVIVQPTVYATDHRLLLDTLARHDNCRGVAIVDDTVPDAQLAVLHEAGVRGARFNLGGPLHSVKGRDEFDRTIERIRQLGWHAKISASGESLCEYEPWLRDLTIPAVLDHFAGCNPAAGPGNAGHQLALALLRQPNWWLMLSNGDRRSAAGAPWGDLIPYARAFIDAAPSRVIWGTDWPHLLYHSETLPDDADLLEFLYRCAGEEMAIRQILVDNPAQLYGFADEETP